MATPTREVVSRRYPQRERQLRGPARSGHSPRQGRDHLGRRTWRQSHPDVLRSAPAGQPVRQRTPIARCRSRRSSGPVPAADSRTGHRHVGLCPDRGRPFSGVWRVQRRVAARSHQRRQGHAARDLRWRVAPRSCRSTEEDGGRGPRGDAVDPSRRDRAPFRGFICPRARQGRTRPLVPRVDARSLRRL